MYYNMTAIKMQHVFSSFHSKLFKTYSFCLYKIPEKRYNIGEVVYYENWSNS